MKKLVAPGMKDAEKAIRGLLEVAEIAMPESYFQTDSRVRRAKRWLNNNTASGYQETE